MYHLSESGFSRLKDFQDLRRENGRDLAPAGRYVYRPAGQTNTPKPQRGDMFIEGRHMYKL